MSLKVKVQILERKVKNFEREIRKLKNMPKCPKCKSSKVIKHGTRKNYRGIIQRFGCKNCDWKFSRKNLDYRMREKGENIRRALMLRKKGYTLSQIADILGGVSRQSIMRWIHKFQKPSKEKIITRKVKNQYGQCKRKFKIYV